MLACEGESIHSKQFLTHSIYESPPKLILVVSRWTAKNKTVRLISLYLVMKSQKVWVVNTFNLDNSMFSSPISAYLSIRKRLNLIWILLSHSNHSWPTLDINLFMLSWNPCTHLLLFVFRFPCNFPQQPSSDLVQKRSPLLGFDEPMQKGIKQLSIRHKLTSDWH